MPSSVSSEKDRTTRLIGCGSQEPALLRGSAASQSAEAGERRTGRTAEPAGEAARVAGDKMRRFLARRVAARLAAQYEQSIPK